jgi:linoleoyl-CoA desaturase
MTFQPVRFKSIGNQAEFYQTLKQRVNQYFEDNNISKNANAAMITKSVAMLSIYLIPYFLIITGVLSNPWLVFAAWIVMGLGMAGVGFSIMHDANHGSYSKNPKVNRRLGNLIYLLGGNPDNWKIQHNVLHHSFTNIDGMDEDLDTPWFLRFSPDRPHHPVHKYQFIYAWPLYGMMTLMWSTTKDFKQALRYHKKNLLKTQRINLKVLMNRLVLSKVVYYILFLALPLILSPVAWWQTLLFYIIMHLVAGFVLGIVFQPAHVIPDAQFPQPDQNRNVDSNWAVHELATTANFAPTNKILSWYVGGLNFQVEHHLFPNICHIHYPKIAPIVKKTAEEFGMPYISMKSFRSALWEHGTLLRRLGDPKFKVAS